MKKIRQDSWPTLLVCVPQVLGKQGHSFRVDNDNDNDTLRRGIPTTVRNLALRT